MGVKQLARSMDKPMALLLTDKCQSGLPRARNGVIYVFYSCQPERVEARRAPVVCRHRGGPEQPPVELGVERDDPLALGGEDVGVGVGMRWTRSWRRSRRRS